MRELLSLYPPFYANSPEMADLQQTLEAALTEAETARVDADAQLCATTATWGLALWERALGIAVPTPPPLPDFRRQAIRAKLRGRGVTSVAVVADMAEAFAPGTSVTVTEEPEASRVTVYFDVLGRLAGGMDALDQVFRELFPAHLGWRYTFRWLTVGDVEGMSVGEMDATPMYYFGSEEED